MVKLCILALMAMVAYTYAAVAIFPYEPKPAAFASQSGCFLSSLNRVLPYNVPYFPKKNGTCVQYLCDTNNQTQLSSCGAIGLPDNCHLEYDYTLDYPKCCGSPVCTPTTTTTEEPSVTVTEPPCNYTAEPSVTVTERPCNYPTEPSVTVTEPPCNYPTEPTTEQPTTETCVTISAVAR